MAWIFPSLWKHRMLDVTSPSGSFTCLLNSCPASESFRTPLTVRVPLPVCTLMVSGCKLLTSTISSQISGRLYLDLEAAADPWYRLLHTLGSWKSQTWGSAEPHPHMLGVPNISFRRCDTGWYRYVILLCLHRMFSRLRRTSGCLVTSLATCGLWYVSPNLL